MCLDLEIVATKSFVALETLSGRRFQAFEIRKETKEWASHLAVGLNRADFRYEIIPNFVSSRKKRDCKSIRPFQPVIEISPTRIVLRTPNVEKPLTGGLRKPRIAVGGPARKAFVAFHRGYKIFG